MNKFIILCMAFILAICSCKTKNSNSNYTKQPTKEDIAIAPASPTFEEQIGISPVIFTGIVSGIHYGKHEQSVYPFTFIDFTAIEFIENRANVKINENKNFQISIMGGMNDDNTITEVDEFPKFEVGQRYLVFLRGGGWKLSPIAGNSSGVYKLYGSLTDDPYLLNLKDIPLKGIEDNHFVFASSVKRDTAENSELQKETILNKNNSSIADSVQNEKMEKTLQFKDKVIDKESGSGDAFPAGYDKLFKLSELKSLITKTKETIDKEKYKKFSEFYFVPVESKGMNSKEPKK